MMPLVELKIVTFGRVLSWPLQLPSELGDKTTMKCQTTTDEFIIIKSQNTK